MPAGSAHARKRVHCKNPCFHQNGSGSAECGGQKGTARVRGRWNLAGIFRNGPGKTGDAGFGMASLHLLKGLVGIPVTGIGALSDEVVMAAVGGRFQKDAEIAAVTGVPGRGKNFELVLGVFEGTGILKVHVEGVAAVDGDAASVGDDFNLYGGHTAVNHVQPAGCGF